MQAGERSSEGRHEARRIEEDAVELVVRGDVVPDDVDRLLKHERLIRAEHGYSLVLVDASAMGAMSPQARKQAADVMKSDPGYVGALAIYGAPFLIRTLINLILRATALISKATAQPMEYFAKRADALAWLHTQRRSLQARHGKLPATGS